MNVLHDGHICSGICTMICQDLIALRARTYRVLEIDYGALSVLQLRRKTLQLCVTFLFALFLQCGTFPVFFRSAFT